jgi:hypothetical protein
MERSAPPNNNFEQWVQIVYLTLRISAEYFSDEQSVTLIRKEEQQ